MTKTATRGDQLKTYLFRVVVEPDGERWQAYCPVLEEQGAVTWGFTEAEALKNIDEVVGMIVEELVEEGGTIPAEPEEEVTISAGPRVAVTF